MEILYIILSAVIIVLLLNNKSSFNEKLTALEFRILELHRLLEKLTKNPETSENAGFELREEPLPKPEVVHPIEPIVEPEPPEKVIPESIPIIQRPIKSRDDLQPEILRELQPEPQKIQEPLQPKPFVPKPRIPAEPQMSFFEKHPDLEKFIGENLINKIGIAILVLAIGYFVKFAIDNNWIGPVGRVGIGVLCGGILIAIAHRLRNSYTAFSSVMVGGGLAVLYFTFTLAYHQFHLFNQTSSFIILIVITCFAVALSLLYNRQELAVIALVGGFASPFMVSGEHANYHALFIYLIILNTGLLVIAYYKSWRILNATAFGLTIIVFSGVLLTLPSKAGDTAFLYASILYLLFFAINVANNVKENKKFIGSDFTILLTNTALYFAAGLYLLTEMQQDHLRGLFTASLGGINLLLSYLLFKNKKVDTNVLYLLIGLTLTFISLAAPIQLHGHYITLFWAAESVLLYWLYKKSGIYLMQLVSVIVWVAMMVSLVLDWLNIYGYSNLPIPIIANKAFITTLVASLSSYLLFILRRESSADPVDAKKWINAETFKYASFMLFFLSGMLEINHQFSNRYPDTDLNILYLMLYIPAFVYIFHIASKKISAIKIHRDISTTIVTLVVVAYLFCTSSWFHIQYLMLELQNFSSVHFYAHWAGAIFVALLFYQLILTVRYQLPPDVRKITTWVLAAAIVSFLSFEISLAFNLVFFSKANTLASIETVYIRAGLPIVWGLSSFAMMWLGMRHKSLTLRVISLTLFAVTLLKLFLIDIRNIPPAGKIAAFFCLGVLLLIISFMYQKVKKIIVADETKTVVPGEPEINEEEVPGDE